MEAVDLPLVDAEEPNLVFLLLPGFNRDAYQGIQFELFPQQGIMTVYCYESGYEERTESEGIVYPVALSSTDHDMVQDMETLRIVDPESIEPDEVGKKNYEAIQVVAENQGL